MNSEQLKALVAEVVPRFVDLRRHIHQHPELSLKEYETSALVRKTLNETGVRCLDPFLGTDVVGVLDGKGPGRNVTLRADIDALPIQEDSGVAYRSRRDGVMHACGHDGHTAMLLGAALVLNKLQGSFEGSVRFVFQPGEEIGGGRSLVEAGILSDPAPVAVLALHGYPGYATGRIGSRPNIFMGGCDFFKIVISGKGGHAARPEVTNDTVLTAARVVEALQAIVSRKVSAVDPAVVSVCRISGGTNANVLPTETELEGCSRYLVDEIGSAIRDHMERIIKGICDTMSTTYSFACESRFLPTINDPGTIDRGRALTRELYGEDAWFEIAAPSLGSEDFSFYLREYAGAMFRVGVGEDAAPLHTPHFDFADEVLAGGIAFLVGMTLSILNGEGQA